MRMVREAGLCCGAVGIAMPEALTRKSRWREWEKVFAGAVQSPGMGGVIRPECLRSSGAIVLARDFRLVGLA